MLVEEPVVPMCLLRAKAIGLMTMTDDQGPDDKVIAVHVDDPESAGYSDVSELSEHRLQELQRFFLDYKVLENKPVTVEDLRGRADAERAIRDAARRYQELVRPAVAGRAYRQVVTTPRLLARPRGRPGHG